MSLPTEIDWALIKMGDGGGTEAFTVVCGLVDTTINNTAATSDRTVRDCAAPGAIPVRKIKVNSRQLDITGSGLSNALETPRLIAALGKSKNYQIETYKADGTDAGTKLGTYAGAFVMTSQNLNLSRDNAASGEITLASDGAWTYTAAS